MEMLLLFISISVPILMQLLDIFFKVLCGLFCFKVTAVIWHRRNSTREDGNSIMHRNKHIYTNGTHFVESYPNCKNGISGHTQIFCNTHIRKQESKLRQ